MLVCSAKGTAPPSGSSRVLGSPGCRIGLCCTGFAFQGELAPCVAAHPKCGCRAQTCHPLSGVSLGTKSSCKEWMTGRSCWCSLLLLSDSSPTGDIEAGRISSTSAYGTNPHRAGLLEFCPSLGLFLRAPAVCACPGHWDQLPWESSGACCAPGEGPAALGSAQPGHQSLLCAATGPWAPALC